MPALSVLFVLMLAVVPLWRLRNLDLLAALSLLATVILFQHGYLRLSVLAVLPGLGYLAVRCAWHGLGPGVGEPDSTPLLDRVTRGWESAQRVRVLRLAHLARRRLGTALSFRPGSVQNGG